MFIEAMLVSGIAFTALCGSAGVGHFDQVAESTGIQEKGILDKWQSNNEFGAKNLLETDDIIEDIRTDLAMIPLLNTVIPPPGSTAEEQG
jgi:hypothetical protein